jgi:glycosyltransferase involved in cell wall biosynthesis
LIDILNIVGLPAYNEEENIAKIIIKLQELKYTVVVCNDGSSDCTGIIAEKLGAIVINHSKNLGYGASIRSIFAKAKELNSQSLVTFDADGQHDVKDIAKILKPIIENKADISIGSRFLEGNETSVPKYRKVGIKVITKLTNSSLSEKITDSQSGFRGYNAKALDMINPSDFGMGISTEILIKANKNNLRIVEIPIKISYEGDTSTHNPVGHGLSVILSTMKFISIEHPLKFYGIPGVIFLCVGFFFIIWTLQGFAETRQIITNISLIGIGSTILGALFLMTSILLFSLVSVVRENHNK